MSFLEKRDGFERENRGEEEEIGGKREKRKRKVNRRARRKKKERGKQGLWKRVEGDGTRGKKKEEEMEVGKG